MIQNEIIETELNERKRSGMQRFASLVNTLGTSPSTNDKLDALVDFFAHAEDQDKVWVIAIFSGRRPKRAVNSTLLQTWCREMIGMEQWLFEECYHTVGDLAETIALLLPQGNPAQDDLSLHAYLEKFALLGSAPEQEKKEFILSAWKRMDEQECFVFNKLITGGFRIGVSQKLMVNALARAVNLDASVIAHRISGNWDPLTISFDDLLSEASLTADHSRPYPFYLAYALETEPGDLGNPDEWIAEWKWDGIRGQVIKRGGELFTWSRGEELVTKKFPEYLGLIQFLPDGTVLDGEIIGFEAKEQGQKFKPLSFAKLQTRIGRKNITKKHLAEIPVGFIAYDLLEFNGTDLRNESFELRRKKLEELLSAFQSPVIRISPAITFDSWDELSSVRTGSRDAGAEGIMLKRKNSPYQSGRKRGDWWKWKIDPLTIDCVMVYAQKGHGRRSNLYTDYTFAVRDGDKLVTFTKAYSGLTDAEFGKVDYFVKHNSLEKFGPVRTVKPELVFEIAFEGIAASARHKSGVALRFPRILRLRPDKNVQDINTLDDLKKMLELYGK